MKDRFVSRIPVLLGYDIETAVIHQDRVRLMLSGRSGRKAHVADHVIAATGSEVDLRRLTFLSGEIRSGVEVIHNTPALSPYFGLLSRICGELLALVRRQGCDTGRFPSRDTCGTRTRFWWSLAPCC